MIRLFAFTILVFSIGVYANEICSEDQAWDNSMAMCMPIATSDKATKMVMLQGYTFVGQTFESGPRGRDGLLAPNMIMADAGLSIGANQYLNLDFMGTLERWTFADNGTPELLQIGETRSNGQPFLDAQHPHSSPVMGLTLSDTISLAHSKDAVKIWFSPRGESTDGPIAFMHRPTAVVNPDAPLGHHIGQDVGHISSTVIGGSMRIKDVTFEVSTFNGTEPDPTKVDLPIRSPNSYAARLIQDYNAHLFTMLSAAYVKSPELDSSTDHVWRYSASVYGDTQFENGWAFHDALIWGLINSYDNASALNSFTEEVLFRKNNDSAWARFEFLQRTLAELEIVNQPGDIDEGHWVFAATLGYTRTVLKISDVDFGIGGSVTKYIVPNVFHDTYGGDPTAGKIFLRVGGIKMWEL